MRIFARLSLFTLFLLMACLMILSCGEKKQGKVIITQEEFNIRQDTDHSWVIDAKGVVEHVGDVAVKKIVVTGFCKSCGEVLVNGKWFVSDYEKTPEQKDIIDHLAPGDEEAFSFRGIAFLMDQSGKKPQEMPEGLEVEVVSFEAVKK